MRQARIALFTSTLVILAGCSSSTTTNVLGDGGVTIGGNTSTGGASGTVGGAKNVGGSSSSTNATSTSGLGGQSVGGGTGVGGASGTLGGSSNGNSGGSQSIGGATGNIATATGGVANMGGASSAGGANTNPVGGAQSVGGNSGNGGSATGGVSATGGTIAGGGQATGGVVAGGGATTGGGAATGGAATGGAATGGAATGGAATGGAATGGLAATGGTTATAPVITSTSVTQGTLGTAYSVTLAATGSGTLTWSRTDGTLPDGLALATNGKISGTPTVEGDFTFQVQVMDSNGGKTTKYFTITVVAIVKAIAAGGEHTCALYNSGRIRCWGANDYGQLGNGTTAASATPVDVTGVATATAIATSSINTCAILLDKTVVCWGNNSDGQLGNGNSSTQLAYRATAGAVSNLSNVASVSSDGGSMCAVTSAGAVYCWGAKATSGSNQTNLTPVEETGFTGTPLSVAGGYTACAIMGAGGLQCWGGNYYGKLANNTADTSTSPVAAQGLGSSVSQVVMGTRHACALENGGILQCWGDNYNDELGVSSATVAKSLTARTVTSLGVTVAANVAAGDDTTCVVTSGGVVECWGDNTYGVMGATTPAKFTSPTPVWSNSNGAKTVTLGSAHGCLLAQDNSVFCWGDNYYAQLGPGVTATYSITPTKVTGL